MNNVSVLYKAELRKIFAKKAVWIATVLGLIFILLVSLTNYSSDGMRAYVKYQEDTLSAISGQKMNDKFFEEFHNVVEKELEEHPERYEKIYANDPGAVYMNASANVGMEDLYDYFYNVIRDIVAVPGMTADEFYESMRYNIEHDGLDIGCSKEEIDTWLEIYDSIDKPISYSYAMAYENILDVLFFIGWVLILIIAIALSGVFADEKTYRTDAMILSSKNGRIPVCLVKIAAGITFALLQTILLLGICLGIMFAFYGTTGWNAMIQNVIPSSPWNITIGNMVLIYLGLAILVGTFFAVTNMILSHLTKSAVATMAIHAAIIFVGLFNIPGKLGLIAKLWQLRPTMALYYGTFCNTYMYGVLNNVQISVVLYMGLTILFALILVLSYKKSQVESR